MRHDARKRRQRRTSDNVATLHYTLEDVFAMMRRAGKDAAQWEAIRPIALKVFARGQPVQSRTPEKLNAMFEALKARPQLIPSPPPPDYRPENGATGEPEPDDAA